MDMGMDKDCIYVFDRGYYDYKWYDKLTENGFKFVTRGVKNSIVMEEKFLECKVGACGLSVKSPRSDCGRGSI